jgi:VWFA-related protein
VQMLLYIGCVLAAAAVVAAQQPVFSTRVDAVRVDVLVTRDNHPVVGLRAEDFDLRDNGIAQQVDVVSIEEIPLNVVLAFDLSESVAGQKLEHLQQASGHLLDGLQRRDRAALVTFNHAVALPCALSAELDCVRRVLPERTAGGRTALVDGAFAGVVAAESAQGRGLVMLFSDGLDTSSWLSPKNVLDSIRRSDVVVYGVSAGNDQSAEFLDDVTSSTGGRHLRLSRLADLSETFINILNEFRHRYVLTYSPKGVAASGWHRLQVRVKRGNVNVKARAGYVRPG